MKSEEEVLVSLANDVSGFIIMCSEKDAEFLTKPHNDRNIEEYMRVFTLAFAFGFRGAFLRVVNIAEENGRADELLENMKGCAHNFPLFPLPVRASPGGPAGSLLRMAFKKVCLGSYCFGSINT